MLIGFSVGNYKSFKETVTLSMVASSITEEEKELNENNVFPINDKLSLLKSAAIYGANASGKSNLIAAINFMKWFVLNSSKETQVSDAIDIEAFRLSTETEKEPSFFEIVFLLEDKKRFKYGFEVNAREVVSEWLFQADDSQEKMLFERDFDNYILDDFPEGQGISDKTRSNALFLSVVAQFNGKNSGKILLWFSKTLQLISGLQDTQYRKETLDSFDNAGQRHDIIEFIKKLDLGILDIVRINTSVVFSLSDYTAKYGGSYSSLYPNSEIKTTVYTFHPKYDADGKQTSMELFDIEKHESEGTNKLFALAGILLDTLRTGKILLIDELDARLHPLITRELICLFNSNETNPHNAQLIFTTHDTNLLSSKTFGKDQIWFTEKDNKGATDLYSLVEYKVGKNASFERDYIMGKYGAIPFIGNFKELIGELHE